MAWPGPKLTLGQSPTCYTCICVCVIVSQPAVTQSCYVYIGQTAYSLVLAIQHPPEYKTHIRGCILQTLAGM